MGVRRCTLLTPSTSLVLQQDGLRGVTGVAPEAFPEEAPAATGVAGAANGLGQGIIRGELSLSALQLWVSTVGVDKERNRGCPVSCSLWWGVFCNTCRRKN
eukprot:RCo048145